MIVGLAGFACLMALAFVRVPIAFAMVIVGFVGFGQLNSYSASLAMTGDIAFTTMLNYDLTVVPLFILMGNLVSRARLSLELYNAAYAFLGHLRGGLAMATLVACGGFSAVCGSSLATAATMAKVAIPPMRRRNYADSLATGAIAAGGTLGILIPPSVLLVIYGIMTESSIGKLFAAGIIPGICGILFYTLAVRAVVQINPELGPTGERQTWSTRWIALSKVWGILGLVFLVIGSIYTGICTPTEASALGAFGAFVFALARGIRDWRTFYDILYESSYTTAKLFFVFFGALVFSNFINLTGMPEGFVSAVKVFELSPYLAILVILLIYILLGCVLESLSMILLTVPIMFPVVISLGFDPIWFGIVVVIVTEISLITPPIGLNVFVLKSVQPDVATSTVFKGVTPFWIADLFRLALIVLVPWLSLFLPQFAL